MFTLRSLLRDARTFVFPVECAGCGHLDVRVCTVCDEQLRARPRFVTIPNPEAPGSLRVLSCGEYGETFARILHTFKDAGRTGLAKDFAPRLRVGITAFVEQASVLASTVGTVPLRFVAPPSTLANQRLRGFDPLALIASHAGITLWHPLESARRREDQARLGVSARADNLRDSLRARGNLAGASVILIDDLMTTGSTLTEMARALTAAGANVEGAVVLAHAERRWPSASLDGRRASTTSSRHARL